MSLATSSVVLRARGPLAALDVDTRRALVDRASTTDATVRSRVAAIIEQVRLRGDAALVDFARDFDKVALTAVEVPRAEWDAAHARNVERVRRQSPDVDVQLLDSPQARRDTLDGMVRERVLLAAAADLQLYPSLSRMAMLFAGAGMWPCSRCSPWSAMPVSPIVMYPGSSGRTA